MLVVHPCLFSMDHNPHHHDLAVGYGSFQQIPDDDVRIEISDADLLQCNKRSPLLRAAKKDHERKRNIYSLLTSCFFIGSLIPLGMGIGFGNVNVAFIGTVGTAWCCLVGGCFRDKMKIEAHRANYLTPRIDQQTAHSAVTVFQHVPSLKKLSFDVASRNIGAYSLDEIRLLSVAPEVKASLEKLHGRYIKLLETSIPSRSPSPCFLDRIPDVNPNMI